MGKRREFPFRFTIKDGKDEIVFHVRRPGFEDIGVTYRSETMAEGRINFALGLIEDIEGIDYENDKGEWEPLTNKVEGWKDILKRDYPDMLMAVAMEYKGYTEPKAVEGSDLFFDQSEPLSQEK